MSQTIVQRWGSGARISVLAGVALVLLGVVFVVVSCADNPPATAPPADRPVTQPSRQPTPDPAASERAAAERAALGAYRGMQEAVTRALANPRRAHPELKKYAQDKALSGIYQTLYFYEKNGIVGRGQPRIAPKVTSVNLDRQPRTATVVDCFDATNWTPVNEATGESVSAPGQNERYPVTAVARELGGRWYVFQSTDERGRTC
jgi:hypothetical protein